MTLPAYAMSQLSFPEIYERALVAPLFQPWAEILLDCVRVSDRDCVLDLARGTGIVARLARQRLAGGGRVVGIDASPQMLAVAAAVAPEIEWREGNATALPVDANESFDVVTCQQGLQFFSDKPAAAREMRRVLAPGGRVAVATWCALNDNPLFEELHGIAERHVGQFVDARHSYGDADAMTRPLSEAGFRNVGVEADDADDSVRRCAPVPPLEHDGTRRHECRRENDCRRGTDGRCRIHCDGKRGRPAALHRRRRSGVRSRVEHCDRTRLAYSSRETDQTIFEATRAG